MEVVEHEGEVEVESVGDQGMWSVSAVLDKDGQRQYTENSSLSPYKTNIKDVMLNVHSANI